MLKKVIEQLDEARYTDFHRELKENRGDKFLRLLELYRENELDDDGIRDEIGINASAFYTLKSRLFDKTQEYLFRTASDTRAGLAKNISSIPHLVYSTPRETAVTLLTHLETELKKLDMPREMISIYNALKKLHLYTDKFYQYQQLYNKTVAYTLAVDKAEELVSSFNRELGEYMLSHDDGKKDVLKLYLKELRNLARLYESHRLKVNFNFACISYALFVATGEDIPETEATTEELLKELEEILDANADDPQYRFFGQVKNYLYFEYYHRLGLHKNALPYYEKINPELDTFLLLSHSCPAWQFLVSKCERLTATSAVSGLKKEFDGMTYQPEALNTPEFTAYSLYAAACNFHDGDFSSGAVFLNNCLNETSLRNFVFAEIQVKLFLVLLLLLSEKHEQAEIPLRSISRKLSSDNLSERFPGAAAFSKFLRTALNDHSKTKVKKLKEAYSAYNAMNNGEHALLKFALLSDDHFALLAR